MIKLNKIKYLVLALFVLIPAFAFAQAPAVATACNATVADLGDFICKIGDLLDALLPLLLSLGVVYFVWGVVQYVIASDEEAKKGGKDRIIFGIIGLAIIVSLWGLVNIVVKTFNLDQSVTVTNPGAVLSNSIQTETCVLKAGPNFADLLNYITCIISSSVIPLIFALSLAMFTWGVVQFVILGAGEEAKREQGRQFMLWGIIALAVMISVWGIVKIVGKTFNIQYAIPTVKGK